MKLDPAALRYLSDDDFRVLTAVEMGMRNHELVPIPLISAISGLRHGGYMRSLKQIHKAKLVHKESKRYVGYRLTSLGYDYLALRALVKRGVLDAVGRPLGVGKEADVFMVTASEELLDEHPELADEPYLAMKLHRLGRTSFRAVKSKRDYLVHRRAASWIYLSRLAAMKEYAFMCALHIRGFPVPRPLGQSRHVVIMELCHGSLLTGVHELPDPLTVANDLLAVAVRFAQHGLIHCDMNEFNIMVDEDGNATVIDFPQMVSTSHADAEMLFNRDVNAIRRFFEHRFAVSPDDMTRPILGDIIARRDGEERLDTIVSASGFKNIDQNGEYGFQDLGDDAAEEDQLHNIDPTSLMPSAVNDSSADAGSNGDEGVTSDGAGPAPVEDEVREENINENLSKVVEDADGTEQDNTNSDDSDCDGEAQEGAEEAPAPPASLIDRAAIEARVRAQRGNRGQRQMLSKRNIIKDSEKRKVKVEMKSDFWQ